MNHLENLLLGTEQNQVITKTPKNHPKKRGVVQIVGME